MGLFEGKKGMVLGVANDFSIAWAITQKLLAEGADVGFTHLPGEKMERRVRKLAGPIGAKVIPRATSRATTTLRAFRPRQGNLRQPGFRAPLDRVRADRRLEGSVRRLEPPGLQNGNGHQRVFARDRRQARRSCALRRRVDPTLTYLGGEKVVPGYNMMGVCKAALDAAVKYLAHDLGPRKIRVNAVSAGPVKTLAASAVGDFEDLAGLYVAVAPLGATSRVRKSVRPECSCFRTWQAESPARSCTSTAVIASWARRAARSRLPSRL